MLHLRELLIGSLAAAVHAVHVPQGESQAPLTSNGDAGASARTLVDSEALQALIHSEILFDRAKDLYEIAKRSEHEYNHPTRVIGSKGHEGTLEYIYSTLNRLDGYYKLSNQTFPAVMGNVFESRLVLGDEVPKSASPMSLTPPTKNKQPVRGDLVLVKNIGCEIGDYPKALEGNIALIQRGECPFGTKSELAGQAGAIAAVIFNSPDSSDEVLHGTLGPPKKNHVATFGVGYPDVKDIISKLDKGKKVDASAYIDAIVEEIDTINIIAQTADGDSDNCVMLGGHTDSVAEGPGINDDGSGSLSLLEIATQLAKFRVNNCVKFAWWAGEEEGLLGSDYYVASLSAEENRKIRLFMDYDMLASPNFAYQIYDANNKDNPVGSGELKQLYVDWYKKHGLNYTFIPFDGRSDYDAFIKHGIPGGGIALGAEVEKTKEEQKMFGGVEGIAYDPCYHQLCDGLDNVNLTAWEVSTKLVAHSVATYALSFEGFPKRTDVGATSTTYAEMTKYYHGSKLIM